MKKLNKGDLVKVADSLGVVTHLFDELEGFNQSDTDDEHVGIWFGEFENNVHKVRTVPSEYCKILTAPNFYH
ncbi:MAG: hypothetical protein NT027_06070 [Proteobacteria bacterium]|nr:hypothetical protein [Pseudomonadota bacterium]